MTGSTKRPKPQKQRRVKPPQETIPTLPFTLPEPTSPTASGNAEFAPENISYWKISVEDLRAIAFGKTENGSTTKSNRHEYERSIAVRVHVQRRAKGYCEGCEEPAPFKNTADQPYLESHHTIPVSQGGPDHPQWVIALCPTCHRHAHYANDAKAFNKRLIGIVNALESENLVSLS